MPIRPAESEELEACANLQFSSEPWTTLGVSRQTILSNLQQETRTVWVILENSKVLGFCAFEMVGTLRGFIKNICVDPARRGQGVGTKLLAAVEEHIFQSSPNVFLCVSSFNRTAQGFYQKQGYQRVGELTDFLQRGASEFLMRKTKGPWLRS